MTDKCSICLEELVGDIGVAVPCGHCFHRNCFARLKAAANCSHFRTATKCCVCKRKVKKFHKIYLNIPSQCCPVEEKTKESIAEMKEENSRLQERLEELQALSNDQSDLLFRILPRYDKLESRSSHLKRENRNLRKRVEALKDENFDLMFDSFEMRSKLSRTEEQLEEAEGENMDLHAIWDTLEDRLEETTHSLQMKKAKRKVRKRSRERKSDKKRLHVTTTTKSCEEEVRHSKCRRVSFDSTSS